MQKAVRADAAPETPMVLIGDATLVGRYALAAAEFDMAIAESLENTAPIGLWQFARAAGLVLIASH